MPQSTPLRPAKTLLAASLTLGTGFISGCVTTWLADNSVQNDAIRPDDFIGEPAELEDQTTQIVSEAVAENATGDNTDQDPANPVRPANKQALSVNAMVGHINGEALFADQVFDVNLAAQLQSFGERYDVDQFNQQAAAAIQERLRGVIINKLSSARPSETSTTNSAPGSKPASRPSEKNSSGSTARARSPKRKPSSSTRKAKIWTST